MPDKAGKTAALELLLSDWNKSDVNYCVWKGSSKLSKALGGNDDLDVLVSLNDSQNAELIAKDLGFLYLAPENYRSDVGTKDFYYYSNIDNKWFHLHIHYQLIFGNGIIRNYHLPVEKHLLSNRIWDDENKLWTLSHEDDLCLFVIRHTVRREVYGKFTNFSEEYNQLLEFHKKETTINDLPKVYPKCVRDYVADTLGSNFRPVNYLRSELLKELSPNKQANNFLFLSLPRIIKKSYVKSIKATSKRLTFGNNYLSKGGVLIGFVGIDGSGKSSAIERLSIRLGSHINTETISLGSGISGASWYRRLAFKVFGTKAKFKGHKKLRENRKHDENTKSNERTKKSYPWYYMVWLIICLWDKKYELHRGFTAKSRGSLVLSDRWLQTDFDNLLDGQRTKMIKTGTFISNYLIKLEDSVFQQIKRNKPDLIIRFDVSPENSVIRKPNDLTHEKAVAATELLESVNWRVECTNIDANQSIKMLDSKLNEIILKQLELHTN